MDLIDRDELRMIVYSTERCNGKTGLFEAISTIITDAPTVDAIPVRHGRWIYLDKDNKFFKKHLVKCSLCNNSLDLFAVNGGRGDANYCPNCGAIMEKPE